MSSVCGISKVYRYLIRTLLNFFHHIGIAIARIDVNVILNEGLL